MEAATVRVTSSTVTTPPVACAGKRNVTGCPRGSGGSGDDDSKDDEDFDEVADDFEPAFLPLARVPSPAMQKFLRTRRPPMKTLQGLGKHGAAAAAAPKSIDEAEPELVEAAESGEGAIWRGVASTSDSRPTV